MLASIFLYLWQVLERFWLFCDYICITINDLFSASALVTAPYLFFPMTVHNIHIFFYILYVFLLNKIDIFITTFEFIFIYRHIYRKWVFLNVEHRFSTGLTETSSRKVFHDGCAKRDIFCQQILNKNRLCLAHCALNRSFTVYLSPQVGKNFHFFGLTCRGNSICGDSCLMHPIDIVCYYLKHLQ